MKKASLSLFYVLIAFVILSTPWKVFRSEKTVGWDHDIYCRAMDVSEQGQDPYIADNLELSLSYTYPSLFLKIYKPFCDGSPRAYIWTQFVLLILLSFLAIRFLGTDPLTTILWVFLGFNAAYANYTTGNVGVSEAFFFTLFLVFYIRQKTWSAFFLVPSSFLKVIPSLMILPAIILDRASPKKWISLISVFLLGILGLNLLSYLISPSLYWSFFNQILGRYSGQHSPIAEVDSNPSNITIPLFLKNLSALILPGCPWLPLIVLSLMLGGFSLWLWNRNVRYQKDRLLALCWSHLILLLWLPRLKPYALLIPCVAVLPILKEKSRAVAIGLLLLTIFHRSINGDKANPLLDFLANNSAVYAYFALLVILSLSRQTQTKGLTS